MIRDKFRDLLVEAVKAEDFDAEKVAHELSRGFDLAMIEFRRRPDNWDDKAQDRLVEINNHLEGWSDRDTWEPEPENG